MPASQKSLSALVEEIGRFYITDRSMSRAQKRFVALMAAGAPTDADVTAYLREARRYFAGFAREARTRLDDVEKRLARVSQLQFNLTAERGVAARRVAATQGVLQKLGEIADP